MKTPRRLGEARSRGEFGNLIRVPFKRSLGTRFVVNSAPD
jgi:hypothetical protein